MAYPKLCEGNTPFTPGSGNGASSAAMLEVLNQLKTMLGPQIVTCPTAAAWYDASTTTVWSLKSTLGYNAWINSGGVLPLWLPLGTLRAGQKITSIKTVIRGSTTGGSILLQKQECGAAVTTPTTVATFPSNPFNTGGSFALATGTMSAETVAAGWDYYLTFTPPGVGQYVLGAYYTAQFGN